jgi:myo-inositol-1(or 4)-monophosphatase
VTDGIVAVGYAPRTPVEGILPVLERLLRSGGVYYRNGSGALMLCYAACGRLLGYIEPHLNSWDCLGALAVIESAGGRSNYRLTDDTLLGGSRIVAGPPAVYADLDAVLGP